MQGLKLNHVSKRAHWCYYVVDSDSYILPQSPQQCKQYHVILGRITAAPECIHQPTLHSTIKKFVSMTQSHCHHLENQLMSHQNCKLLAIYTSTEAKKFLVLSGRIYL